MKRISRKSGIPRDTGITPLHSNEKGKALITFSLKYTAINIGVSVLGFPVYAVLFYFAHHRLHRWDARFHSDNPSHCWSSLHPWPPPNPSSHLLKPVQLLQKLLLLQWALWVWSSTHLLASVPLRPWLGWTSVERGGWQRARGGDGEHGGGGGGGEEHRGRVGLSCVPVFFF